MSTLTQDQELAQWIGRLEQHLQSLRSGLGGIEGRPRVDRLRRLQDAGRDFLRTLVAVFWAQSPASRAVLLRPYLSALMAVKLFCDDVYVEAAEEARQPRRDKPSPVPVRQQITNTYRVTIEDWIVGSPLIDPATNRDNRNYLPHITNLNLAPSARYLRSPIENLPRQRARSEAQRDVQRISGSAQTTRLRDETSHLLGIVFLLAQLELELRWDIDQPLRSGVDSWYEAASRPVGMIADEVLGVFDDALRSAVAAGKTEEADRLLTARHLAIIDLATRYSLRGLETRVLLIFFDKQNMPGPFASQASVFGVNGVQEILYAYVGKPNPDDPKNRDAVSVAHVRARQVELAGTRVKVFGRLDPSGTQLIDELTKQTVQINPVGEGALGFHGVGGEDRRVIVEGSLSGSGKALEIDAETIAPNSEGYRALIGFPLRFAQTDEKGNLVQLPAWRRPTDALQRAARRELREQDEEGVFSVAETLAGQREFVTDLLRLDEVRKAFATPLAKKRDLDLQDSEVRAKIWSVLFRSLAKNGNRRAMELFGFGFQDKSGQRSSGYLQRYFSLFTRHTYYNLRDSGKPYLSSNWPTDLTNRKIHDCGVYAVQAAYDLFRAVQGTPNLTLEFRFLTFLDHLCLIVFFGNAAFLVNNASIYPPRDIKPQGTPTDDDRVDAAFKWGQRAYTTVYHVDYAFFLAVLPRLSLDTARSDTDFKTDIWKMYLRSQGWGISHFDETIAGNYFRAIDVFDTKSKDLANQLNALKTAKAATPKDWDAATTLALELYKLGEDMTERKNFVFFNKDFVKANPIPKVGFASPDYTTDGAMTLPMYELAELLKQRKRNGHQLTGDQDALAQKRTRVDHVRALTERFN